MNIQGIPSVTHGLATAQTSPAGTGGSSTSGTTSSSNSAENTFIQLLVTELKSQDPTSPMDPTTMVGQMFSMNQLQQLIDINQTLSAALGGVPPSSSGSSAVPASSNSTVHSNVTTSVQAATQANSAAALYAQHLLKGAN